MKKLIALIIPILILGLPLTSHALSRSVQVNVSCTIAPMFELEVSGPAAGNIDFGTVHKDADGALTFDSSEVVIRTKTNLGQPYHVTQMLLTPIQNEEGHQFSAEDFTSRAVAEKSGGNFVSEGAVSTAPVPLFVSNDGKSNVITANYQLKVKPEQPSGHYASKLVYTIATI